PFVCIYKFHYSHRRE
ncbi:hypothetical protein CP082626L3_1022B, partial [Chlamydia psittaci 08-2626_L3]